MGGGGGGEVPLPLSRDRRTASICAKCDRERDYPDPRNHLVRKDFCLNKENSHDGERLDKQRKSGGMRG